MNPITNPSSIAQSKQKKLFHVYKRARKEFWNDREFKLAIKRQIKTFTCIKCQKFQVTMGNLFEIDEIQLSQQKSLIKILKCNKSLLSLKLPIQSPNTFPINITLLHLKNIRALSDFTLELASTGFVTSKTCYSFALSVKNLKQLRSLNHNLYQDLQTPSKSLKTFQHFLTLRYLANLSLSFRFTKTFTDKSFSLFSHHLSHLQSLTSLSLNLDGCQGLTKIGLSHLFSSLSKLPLLKAFSLESYGFQVLDSEILVELFQHLKNLSSFQELALTLSLCQIPRISAKEPLTAGLDLLNPTSLRRISLDFYSKFSDSDLWDLFVIIKQFTALTHLEFGFSQGSQVTGQGLTNLHQILTHFPSLTHFSLMENSRIDAKVVLNSLSLSLENLKQLQSLKIMIYSNRNLNDSSIQNFSAKLSELSELKYLDLDFEECQKLSDQSLESIGFALRGLENLASLHLNFEMIDKVTNQGVMALGSSLANLKGLKNLQLKLGNNENGDSLGPLIASLKLLNCLNEIYLNFGHFGDQSGSSNYEELIEMIKGSDLLQKIFLQIPQFREDDYCNEIAEKASNSSKDFTIIFK